MVTYYLKVSKRAKKDKEKIKQSPVLEEKVKSLIKLIEVNPYQNPPHYEKLVGDYKDMYSRRINRQHRLIYKVDEEQKTVIIISMWTHYE
ncbi:MAG: Txe/YoeB family addiction module toxin [Eubacteriaceae bacterium]